MDFIIYFQRRPIIATALSIALFLAGAMSLPRLPVSLFPSVQLNDIIVNAVYPGASTDLMDGRVASEILSAISDVEDVDYVVSRSTQGATQINLALNVDANLQETLSQVSERVRAISNFPRTWILWKSAVNRPILLQIMR